MESGVTALPVSTTAWSSSTRPLGSVISMAPTQLSKDAYERLQSELDDLTTRGRVEIAATIERARGLGGLSENGDYHGGKDDQGGMEARHRQLEARVETGDESGPA